MEGCLHINSQRVKTFSRFPRKTPIGNKRGYLMPKNILIPAMRYLQSGIFVSRKVSLSCKKSGDFTHIIESFVFLNYIHIGNACMQILVYPFKPQKSGNNSSIQQGFDVPTWFSCLEKLLQFIGFISNTRHNPYTSISTA